MVSKKTDPLLLGRKPEVPARRNTDLMGLSNIEEPAFRDTIKDPTEPLENLLPAGVDPKILDGNAAAENKRAFLEESSQNAGLRQALGQLQQPAEPAVATPRPRGGTMPMSARVESLEAEVPVAKAPAPVGGRVDLSRADPRRAPTERVAKRPNEILEPDWSVAHRAPPQPPVAPAQRPAAQNQLFNYALVLFGLMAAVLVVLVIYVKVLR